MTSRVLILGVNGFIGSNLTRAILEKTDWHVCGLDLDDGKLAKSLNNPRFQFMRGDIRRESEWIEAQVQRCDVVLPLVAIATPSTYVKDPLAVYELDFEANIPVIRLCAQYGKRLIFPSTSEVYGMSPDLPYDEDESALVTGPICKSRWIYSSCKQLLDRVIAAYGERDGLDYTLFRPFNWFGPLLDNVWEPKEGSSRVVTQFLGNALRGRDLVLVNGGMQKRCFLYIDDGIDALLRIIENKNACASRRIFNIGHPGNEISVRDLAEEVRAAVAQFPEYSDAAGRAKLVEAAGEQYYGQGYQDIGSRVPSIENAKKILGWEPQTSVREGLKRTVEFYLQQAESARLEAVV